MSDEPIPASIDTKNVIDASIEPNQVNATKIGQNLLAGAAARCSAATIMFPVDVIKTRLQFQRRNDTTNLRIRKYYTNGFSALTNIIKDEGFLALYRGLPIRLIYITPAAAVSFTVYEQFMTAFRKTTKSDWVSWQTPILTLCAGAGARVLGTACRTPLDILKQQLQVEGQLVNHSIKDKKGIMGTARNIIKTEGFKGYFAGYGVTLLRDAPFAAIYFTSYELLKMQLSLGEKSKKTWQHLVSGACAGAVATCCTIPVDVVKTRLQTQSKLGVNQYSGIKDCFVQIYQQEGIKGLTSGLGPRLAYIMPAAAITFTFYEKFKGYFE
ncbi:hypothetical protein AKO1_003294 [Acrasis kona]|uniref:Mitochondrial carrier protein n=1 Tax=Acrasis kona TaxID=1008807 RepID=A0AAW2Z902_9EUKA